MNQGIPRWILHRIHLVFGISIIGYIYSPFDQIPNYAPLVCFLSCPCPLGTLDVERPSPSTTGFE
jgi:hypothetical protein